MPDTVKVSGPIAAGMRRTSHASVGRSMGCRTPSFNRGVGKGTIIMGF